MNKVDLAYAFKLPPEKAVEYFRQKGYTFSWDWQDTLKAAQAKAFTVAKALRLDILQDIRGAVDTALAEGRTFQQFQKELAPILKSKGWWGKVMLGDGEGGGQAVQLGSPWRLKTIYQTNLQTSYMAGRWAGQWENRVNRPYLMYVAVLDSRTRPAHRALHGTIAPIGASFWRYFYPPNGWRCRCRVRSLSNAEAIQMVKDGQGVWVSEKDLSFRDALLSAKTGETDQVAVYRGMGLNGKVIDIAPDVGWSYNPGQAWQEPFVPRPLADGELAGGIKTVGAPYHQRTPVTDLPAKAFTQDMLLPPHQASGWSEAEYVDKFLAEFGATTGNPVVYRDKIDDAVVISEDLFRDRKENALKVFRADREVYLKLLADTIKEPVEIWLTEVKAENGIRLCKRYIGMYQGEGGKVGGFVVFDLIDGQWQGTTTFAPEKLSYLDNQRRGTLLYTKE